LVIFNEVFELNIGKSGNEFEQLISVNECSVKKHLQGVFEIHEEIFAELIRANRRQRTMKNSCTLHIFHSINEMNIYCSFFFFQILFD
jgi:hypothetical protein